MNYNEMRNDNFKTFLQVLHMVSELLKYFRKKNKMRIV